MPATSALLYVDRCEATLAAFHGSGGRIYRIASGEKPDEELRHLFTVIASLIAPLIRLNILCEEKKHAIADPFASLAERLNRELGRAGKFNLPLAIALVRINKLSAYCTANSYPAGMALLDQLQEFFLPEVPSAESIIRFGLNSFAVIQAGKDSREAKERMEAAVVRARAALPALAGLDVAVRVSAKNL